MLRTNPLVMRAKFVALVPLLLSLTARAHAQAGPAAQPPAAAVTPPPPAADSPAPTASAPAPAPAAPSPTAADAPPPAASAPAQAPALDPAAAAATAATPPTAAAVDGVKPAPVATLSDWYGWQLLLVDLAGLTTGVAVAASVEDDASTLGMLAGTWYGVSVIGAPAVHWAHDHWSLGASDFAMRAFAPPIVGMFGVLASCLVNEEFEDQCTQTGLGVGTLLGIGLASAFDALILARSAQKQAPRESGEWYGLQIMMVDLLGYLVGAYYAARGPQLEDEPMNPVIALWAMHYLITTLAAPIVHFVHGQVGYGFASLGSRLVIGPMGALIGVIGFCAATGTDDCAETGATWGLLGGGLIVALFDSFLFAYEPNDAPAQSSSIGVTVGPGSVGLAGRF